MLLFGRHDVGGGRRRTGIWQVLEDVKELQLIADLESYGDTGSPGLLQLDDSTALLLYYTSSKADPRAAALDHEATQLEAIRLNLASDMMAVTLNLLAAPIGK